MKPGTFYGLGVGPGPAGLLPLAALEVLRRVELIYAPRSRVSAGSVALRALAGLEIPRERVREVEFLMDGDDARLAEHYAALAREIAGEQRAGRTVAYLTLGDALTYSTLGYLVAALAREAPELPREVLPGVTSYAAAAARTGFSLGEGKERVLILPCPDDMAALRTDILTHDVVVLMKVGHRLPAVLTLLGELGILAHCALAHRLGLEGEEVRASLFPAPEPERLGYLSVLLIRKSAPRRFT
ncbi:precorrin-2 C(20)-methyltransferase [Deinococcus sp. YIM 77859]|uniref:precorrin-2 C(20)-methyltransferase n=1 Tax=Deinococcus sp. YIM 77859 TaxID=1540221 RepID=UPI00055041F9|nr:precorrin-2 C(20)-methyltransferase [Deinococcus sp. YIM 77859]